MRFDSMDISSFWNSEPRTLLILSCLISFACIIYVWRKPGRPPEKIFWTVAVLVPVLGPLFLGAFYRPPVVQPPHLRGRENEDTYLTPLRDGGSSVSGEKSGNCAPTDTDSQGDSD